MFWFEPLACRWCPFRFQVHPGWSSQGWCPDPVVMARSAQLFQGQTVVIEGSAVVGVRSLSPYISNFHQPNHFLYFWDPVFVKRQKFYHNDVTNINCLHDHWNTFIRLHYFLVIVECHNPTRRRWTFILYIMHFVSLYLNWLWVSGWSRGNNIKTKQQGITLDVLNSCLNFSTSSVFTSARLFSSNHSFAPLYSLAALRPSSAKPSHTPLCKYL